MFKRKSLDSIYNEENKRSRCHSIDTSSISSEYIEDAYTKGLESSQSMLENCDLNMNIPNLHSSSNNSNSSPIDYLILELHPDVIKNISSHELHLVQSHQLDRIALTSNRSSIVLRRDAYQKVFGTHGSIKTDLLSRCHCKIYYDTLHGKTFLEDMSSNTIRVGKQHPYPSVGKGNRTSLKHGDTVVLLSNVKNGNLTLGYIVHDPYITSVMNQSVESTLEEKTLQMAISVSAPLAVRNFNGSMQGVETLDYQSMYETITSSLQNGRETTDESQPVPLSVGLTFGTRASLNDLLNSGCDIVHFSAHGNDTDLFLEDVMYLRDSVKYTNLSTILERPGCTSPLPSLAVIVAPNARRIGDIFMQLGCKSCIAVELEGGDDGATMDFLSVLYVCFGMGHTLRHSFNWSVRHATASALDIKLKYQLLFSSASSSHDYINDLFVSTEGLPIIATSVPRSSSNENLELDIVKMCPDIIPPVCQPSSARKVQAYKICSNFIDSQKNPNSSRITSIVGNKGIGKTTLAYFVARYLCVRRLFTHGVHVFELKGLVEESLRLPSHSYPAKQSIFISIDIMLNHLMQRLCKTSNIREDGIDSLLVFDGLEDLPGFSLHLAQIMTQLLPHYPHLQFLITSHSPIMLDSSIKQHIIKLEK